MNFVLLLALVAAAAALVGCLTGLVPGLHVNTLAVVLVATAPAWTPAVAAVDAGHAALLVGAFILAVSVSHTFVNIVPATYLGAPDEATALAVLPAHRLLLSGFGYYAVRVSAYASFFAVVASLLLVLPVRWLLVGPPDLWAWIRTAIPWLLLALVAFLVVRERRELGPPRWNRSRRRWLGRGAGLLLLLAAGLYGLIAFQLPYAAFVPIPPSPLLPALGGLFGAATLAEALAQQARVPHQFVRLRPAPSPVRGSVAALGVGVAAGAGMSLLPGLTNATATAVAGSLRRATSVEMLVSLGAVNTANAFFNLLVLYLFGRTRSGAVVALAQLLPVEPWTAAVPPDLVALLFAALAAAVVSLLTTLALGRWAARRIHRVPYRPLLVVVLVYVVAVVVVFTGIVGLAVFLVGAALGLVPVRAGLSRTHLTGVLLVPTLGYLFFGG